MTDSRSGALQLLELHDVTTYKAIESGAYLVSIPRHVGSSHFDP